MELLVSSLTLSHAIILCHWDTAYNLFAIGTCVEGFRAWFLDGFWLFLDGFGRLTV